MIALIRGRTVALTSLVAAAALGAVTTASAQTPTQQRPGRASTTPQQTSNKPAPLPPLKPVQIPTNPSDAIAIVNTELITRQQLADECVAKYGKELLDTLIARRLIDQAMRGAKLEITAAEVDAEVEVVAMQTAKMTGEVWLRALEENRGISAATYKRDIIYPTLALKKLAAKRVQVTEEDIKKAFEANFGERIRCRLIMVDTIHAATQIWNELQRNPAGFERLAREQSRDNGTKASGGLLPEPIARHANPESVSTAAFRQLVDGNPDDKDSKGNPIKPKDGAITGPIQVSKDGWVILKREELLPANQNAKLNDPFVRDRLKAMTTEAKQQDAVAQLFNDLMRASTIENRLTGKIKLANEEEDEDFQKSLDEKIQPTGGGQPLPANRARSVNPAPNSTSPNRAPITPAGVSSDAAGAASRIAAPLKPGGSAPTSPRN